MDIHLVIGDDGIHQKKRKIGDDGELTERYINVVKRLSLPINGERTPLHLTEYPGR